MFSPYLNIAIQRIRTPALDWFFQLVSALGYRMAFLAVLLALLLAWDKRKAFGLALFVGCAGLLNHLLKEIFQMPRPFQVAPESIAVLDLSLRRSVASGLGRWVFPAAASYGFPSGHAQMAVCLWGGLAVNLRKRWAWIAAAVLAVLTAFSRLYLGVHFLGDVLGGLAIGSVLLFLYAGVVRIGLERDRFPSRDFAVSLVFLLPLLLFFLHPDRVAASRAALILGAAVGYFGEERFIGFSTAGSELKRLFRLVVGFVLVAGIEWVLRKYTGEVIREPLAGAACRYFLLGLSVMFAAPWILVRMRLAERTEKSPSQPLSAG